MKNCMKNCMKNSMKNCMKNWTSVTYSRSTSVWKYSNDCRPLYVPVCTTGVDSAKKKLSKRKIIKYSIFYNTTMAFRYYNFIVPIF